MSATTIQDISSDVKCLVAAGSFGASFRKVTPGRASDQVPPPSPVSTTAGAGNVRQKHNSNQLCLWGTPHGFSAQRAGSLILHSGRRRSPQVIRFTKLSQ